jgi:hypothetical protein
MHYSLIVLSFDFICSDLARASFNKPQIKWKFKLKNVKSQIFSEFTAVATEKVILFSKLHIYKMQ